MVYVCDVDILWYYESSVCSGGLAIFILKIMVLHVVVLQHGLHGSSADFDPLEAALTQQHNPLTGQLIVVNISVSQPHREACSGAALVQL